MNVFLRCAYATACAINPACDKAWIFSNQKAATNRPYRRVNFFSEIFRKRNEKTTRFKKTTRKKEPGGNEILFFDFSSIYRL